VDSDTLAGFERKKEISQGVPLNLKRKEKTLEFGVLKIRGESIKGGHLFRDSHENIILKRYKGRGKKRPQETGETPAASPEGESIRKFRENATKRNELKGEKESPIKGEKDECEA